MTAKGTERAVFLDRDGCISPDQFGYISDPAGYSLYPYTGEALRILRDLGYQLFVVTNQSGIARGYFDVPALERVHKRLKELLTAEGVKLAGLYYSPYFAEGIVRPYNRPHEDRKPGLGMFKRARREHPFDPGRSWMLGDRYSDVEFGKKAGLKTVLLLSGHGAHEMLFKLREHPYKPDFMAENLLTAARLIQMLHP
ncbi:MAG TPA: HAD family hydrolase [Candidatus Syntrophosphaera sp.]|jgi:histidinol-phosphate phosphatase family protein|nr:HAD family hydrolase [Candidatus Syntrophosphaera sp.]